MSKSKAQRLIDAIRAAGTIRSPDLAAVTRIDRSTITATLRHAVEAGEVVVCKVMIPGKPELNEYRLGMGVAPMAVAKPLNTTRRAPLSASRIGRGSAPSVATDEKSIINPFQGDELAPTRGLTRPNHTQPAVVQNSGSDRLVSSSGTTPAKAIAVDKTPAPRHAAWADESLLERIPTMTVEEFGEFVAWLSRLWAWGNAAPAGTQIQLIGAGSARLITHTAGA